MKHRSLTLSIGMTLASLLSAEAARAAGPPRLTQIYPRDAVLVKVADAATLQQVLDTQRVVRLEPGNYGSAPPLVLRSGQQLYGLRSALPVASIEPGASGIILSNVDLDFRAGLTFPPSALVTRHNLLFEVRGNISIDAATLEENTFLGMEGGRFQIDTSNGGWLRNNRFIRVRNQGAGPLLTLTGDSAQQSYGNVFLWGNELTQPSGMVSVVGQRDVTFVGWDDEAYADSTTEPIYRFKNVDTLRLWTMGGYSPTTNQPLFDIDAKHAHLAAVTMGGAAARPVVLGPAVERAFAFDTPPIEDQSPAGMRLFGESNINNNTGSPMRDHDARVTGLLPQATAEALSAMLTTHTGDVWERPVFDPIADPAGPNWNRDLAR